MGVSQSIADGYMGRCAMVWTTAGTNRVCSRCLALKDTVVGYTDESGVTIPPLHPRCRCAIMYDEVGTPRATRPKPATSRDVVMPLLAPLIEPLKPEISTSPKPSNPAEPSVKPDTEEIVAPPFSLEACKTFKEFKLYWAENYNVKVNGNLGELHFESVRMAATGIEMVLKEFPPAGFYLNEFDVLRNEAIMSTARGLGKIYFNPDDFANAKRLEAIIKAGVKSRLYPKNMTILGVGAHEATHVVEDWLIAKYHSVHTDFRPIARRLVYEALKNAKLTAEGRKKSFNELKEEIASYALRNHSECLASGVSDYITNKADSAILSKTIWTVLKKELAKMIKPGVLKMMNFSLDEFEKYGVYDEWGELVGVKDDAPADFKEAWAADQKLYDEAEKNGITL